jgi:V-type H+-transporting ATPase subunit a
MVFFQSIFGYLVFTIIFKWSVDWKVIDDSPPSQSSRPPSLLNMLIYMFLSPGTIEEPLYRGQKPVQVLLLLLAVVCVPILLLLKPLYLRWEHNRARALGYRGISESTRVSALDGDDEDEGNGNDISGGRESFNTDEGVALITEEIRGEEHEEFEFSDVMIHQVIHTIGMSYALN